MQGEPAASDRPLAGCRAAITRERPGRLGALLEDAGAEVVHVPLIEVIDADDAGAALDVAVRGLRSGDWVMVTSEAGADRTVEALDRSGWPDRLLVGCVGSATAGRWEALTGRRPDLVPARQLGVELARSFVERHTEPGHVVVAQADRANPGLVDALRASGHDVDAVVAYRTRTRSPSDPERARLVDADAVLFASGSAVDGWTAAMGADAASVTPPLTVVIGPTTAEAASRNGLKNVTVAADYSVPGLVRALIAAWRDTHE